MHGSRLPACAAFQGIRLGRASFQKVKQALQGCRAFEVNLNIVALHNFIDWIVQCDIDGAVRGRATGNGLLVSLGEDPP